MKKCLIILIAGCLTGCTSIQKEAEIGSLHGVKLRVERGVNVNSKTPAWRMTALHCAANNGHTQVVAYLIEQGADVNIRAEGGDVPLHRAARNGHIKVMKLLIENGTDLMQYGTGCGTPLQWAARADQLRAAELLINAGADVDNKGTGLPYRPLRDAIAYDNPEMVKLLLRHGADVNAVVDNSSSLFMTCLSDNKEIAKILLSFGANPDLPCKGKSRVQAFVKELSEMDDQPR